MVTRGGSSMAATVNASLQLSGGILNNVDLRTLPALSAVIRRSSVCTRNARLPGAQGTSTARLDKQRGGDSAKASTIITMRGRRARDLYVKAVRVSRTHLVAAFTVVREVQRPDKASNLHTSAEVGSFSDRNFPVKREIRPVEKQSRESHAQSRSRWVPHSAQSEGAIGR